MTERFQALADLPQHGRIRNRTELPFDMAERLNINTQAVEWLLQLGGYYPLYLLSDNDKQGVDIHLAITGVSPSGEASASLLGAKKPALGSSYDGYANGGKLTGTRSEWKALDITLYIDAVIKELHAKQLPVQDAKAWATILDAYLRKVLISNSLKSTLAIKLPAMVDDLTAVLFAELTYGFTLPYYQYMMGTEVTKAWLVLPHLALWSALKNILSVRMEGLEDGTSGHRLSISGTVQIDRALGVLAVGAFSPLIRAR